MVARPTAPPLGRTTLTVGGRAQGRKKGRDKHGGGREREGAKGTGSQREGTWRRGEAKGGERDRRHRHDRMRRLDDTDGESQDWAWSREDAEPSEHFLPCEACTRLPKAGDRQCKRCSAILCSNCRCTLARCIAALARRRAAAKDPDAPTTRSRGSTPPRGGPVVCYSDAPTSGNWDSAQSEHHPAKRPRDRRRTGDSPPATSARSSLMEQGRRRAGERPRAGQNKRRRNWTPNSAGGQGRRVHPR